MALLQGINSPADIKKLNSTQLEDLSKEIREFLVENVMHTGGHLASNLGVVELTLALAKVFDFPKDKLVFDVGHQCYVYKILTGRRDSFNTLRHLDGISGFPRRNESEYDAFDVGHAGTSISAAVGMARARDLGGGDEHIISLVGDGALTSGMTFEALNDVGQRKTKVIIILNDNAMSIHKNVGGLSLHLSKLRFTNKYQKSKDSVQSVLEKFGKVGKKLSNGLRSLKDRIKYAAIAAPLFEDLGITYMGIVDGNSIKDITNALVRAIKTDGPVIIHTYTTKGLGFPEAETNPSKFHGISSETDRLLKGGLGYDTAFSRIITSLAENNPKLTAITAAMASGCGLVDFSEKYPNRFFDVGIAEEHAVTMAAGLAVGGYVPVVCVYSTFLQRSYDQIIHDVCLQNLHVVFAIGHSGLTGEDGETHQGLMDMAMLLPIPNMTILAPSDYAEFKAMLDYAVNHCTGPVAVRYPKAEVSFREIKSDINPVEAEVVTKGTDVLLVSVGRMLDTALEVEKLLEKDGVSTTVINVRSLKPLDTDTISKYLLGKKLLVTVEDGIKTCGAGYYITGKIGSQLPAINFGFDTCFVRHGNQKELFALSGLDSQGIYKAIIKKYKGMA